MANVNFEYNEPAENTKVYIEQVFAEKPAGGMIAAPTADILPTTAVGYDSNGKLQPIKAYRVVEDATAEATSIKVAKGSNVASGDVIAVGSVAVASTAVSTTNDAYDTITVTLGVAVKKGDVLYQAASASANAATPIYTPKYVTGNFIEGGKGDAPVRLINGANLRKETAQIGEDIAALMPSIALV